MLTGFTGGLERRADDLYLPWLSTSIVQYA
jgi:hypothetical protein